MKKWIFFVLVSLLLIPSSRCLAEPGVPTSPEGYQQNQSNSDTSPINPDVSPWAKEEKYIDRATQKLDYGMRNFYLGWSQIFNEPIKHHEGMSGALKSVGKGFLLFPVDTIGGLITMITFPMTDLYIPLPEGGLRTAEGEAPGGYFHPS